MIDPNDSWDGITLEEWVEQMLNQGYTAIVVQVIKTLPDAKKEKYRAIWRRVMDEKKRAGHQSEI